MQSTIQANNPQQWDELRNTGQGMEYCPTLNWRYWMLVHAVEWAWNQAALGKNHIPHVVLDVAAGIGALGHALKRIYPDTIYHATEQTEDALHSIRGYADGASVAQWVYGSGQRLEEALAAATDIFERQYPVVVLSHCLEHVEDYYGFLDQVWGMVATPGFLLVCLPEDEEHRSHYTRWDWKRLLKVLRQYGAPGIPLAVWPEGSWADLLAAVPKAPVAEQSLVLRVAQSSPEVPEPLARGQGSARAAPAAPAPPPSSLSSGLAGLSSGLGSPLSASPSPVVARTDPRFHFEPHQKVEMPRP